MLRAMIRHVLWIPFVLVVLVVLAPLVVGCDQLKKDSADAAAVAVPPGTAKPVTDGGKPVDAGAVVVTDAGKTAPTPTPTFTIPTAIPGFDAGAFKPPPGFPTTLPTFPPPPPAK